MKKKLIKIIAIIILLAIMTPLFAHAEDEYRDEEMEQANDEILIKTMMSETNKTGTIELTTSTRFDFPFAERSDNINIFNVWQIYSLTGSESDGWEYEINPNFADFEFNGLKGNALIDFIYSLEDDMAVHGPNTRLLIEALIKYIRVNGTTCPAVPTQRIHPIPQDQYEQATPVKSITFPDVPLGYYLIGGTVSSCDGISFDRINRSPFVVLANTREEGTSISVNPKADFINLVHRLAEGQSDIVSIGDIVDYEIEVEIPPYTRIFDLSLPHDEMYWFQLHAGEVCYDWGYPNIRSHERLAPGSIEVYVGDITGRSKADEAGYHIRYMPEPWTGSLFTIEFNYDFLEANIGKNIYVTYSTIVTEQEIKLRAGLPIMQGLIRLGHRIYLEHDIHPTEYPTIRTYAPGVSLYTSEINLYKYTGDINSSHRGLVGGLNGIDYNNGEGVQFTISTSPNEQNGMDINLDNMLLFNITAFTKWFGGPEGWSSRTFFVYMLSEDQTIDFPELPHTKFITTDPGGHVTIYGLNAGTYYLYEVQAPEGYSRLKEPVKIEISIDGEVYYAKEITVTPNTNVEINGTGMNVIAIRNVRSSMFPETGGIGYDIFALIGGVLMLCSGTAYFIKRRISKKDE